MVNRRRHDDSDDDDTDSVTSEDFCESFEVAGDRVNMQQLPSFSHTQL